MIMLPAKQQHPVHAPSARMGAARGRLCVPPIARVKVKAPRTVSLRARARAALHLRVLRLHLRAKTTLIH